MAGFFFGSSPNFGKRGADLEEKVGVVAEAVRHRLDHLGAERPATVSQDARQIDLQALRRGFERAEPAARHGAAVPSGPEPQGVAGMAVLPEAFKVILEQV